MFCWIMTRIASNHHNISAFGMIFYSSDAHSFPPIDQHLLGSDSGLQRPSTLDLSSPN